MSRFPLSWRTVCCTRPVLIGLVPTMRPAQYLSKEVQVCIFLGFKTSQHPSLSTQSGDPVVQSTLPVRQRRATTWRLASSTYTGARTVAKLATVLALGLSAGSLSSGHDIVVSVPFLTRNDWIHLRVNLDTRLFCFLLTLELSSMSSLNVEKQDLPFFCLDHSSFNNDNPWLTRDEL